MPVKNSVVVPTRRESPSVDDSRKMTETPDALRPATRHPRAGAQTGDRAGDRSVFRRGRASKWGLAAAAVCLAACGSTPTTPTPPPVTTPPPITPPPVVTPPPNNLPVIDSITIQGRRLKEPSNFADLTEIIDVTAKVRDDETPVEQLEYRWKPSAGTVDGTGARVTWTAPGQAQTPLEVTITLTVVEKYGPASAPLAFEHSIDAGATLSVHDSVKEVGDMARQFLLDFSDSNIRDVKFIMRNFTTATLACQKGTDSETGDVTRNRVEYFINQSFVGPSATTIGFGGSCPFRNRPADGCAQVPVDWRSTRLIDPTEPGGTPKGASEHAFGVDQVTAIYVPAQKKWGLCDSDFNAANALIVGSTFIR